MACVENVEKLKQIQAKATTHVKIICLDEYIKEVEFLESIGEENELIEKDLVRIFNSNLDDINFLDGSWCITQYSTTRERLEDIGISNIK